MDGVKVVKKPEPTQADKLREALVLMGGQRDRAEKIFADVIEDVLKRIEALERERLTT